MSRTGKIIPLCLVLLFLSGVAYLIFAGYRSVKEGGDLSCISSSAGATGRAVADHRIELNEKSRELTGDEIKIILDEYKPGDCSRTEPTLKDIHIAIGEVNKVSKSPIRVWTNGRDGVSGTSDDLVIPWEENH